MKKKLVASLAAAMILGVAGTSFAAANPFTDVPAKHWAYDSVTKLAQAGIVDGYGDGTYRGDKLISRYEMAQMVGKAMSRSDKADAAQKAEINKLATEFAEELNTMGVRVTTLEKNQPNLKFTGTFLLRYTAQDFDNSAVTNASNGYYRLRLDGQAVVDKNTTFNTRFVTRDPMKVALGNFGLPTCSTTVKLGQEPGQTDNQSFDRFNIASKIGNVTVTAGRQPLIVGVTSGIVDAGAFNFDGVKLAIPMGQAKLVLNHGRLIAQKDIDVAELSTTAGKLNIGIGYDQIKDNAPVVAAYNGTTSLGKDMLKLQYAYATYNFAPKFSMTVEGGQNKADYATHDNKYWNAFAKIGDQALNDAGKQNFIVEYYSVGANALALDNAAVGTTLTRSANGLTTLDTTGTTTKFTGLDLSYNRAFSKNLSTEFHYVKIDDKATNVNDYNYFRVNVVSKF